MKKFLKKVAIIFSLIILFFFILYLHTRLSDTFQKEEERIIASFGENKHIFEAITDYLISKEYEFDNYISKENIDEYEFTAEEHEKFDYIFNSLNYTRIEYRIAYYQDYTIIKFIYNSNFEMAREIIFIGENDIDWDKTGGWTVKLAEGWYLWSFGYV
ncbi:MAG: hypothetical protein FWF82_05545 [Oscillospiraceae bacterium]|nr:hypothetical protein [Oscillospiraceae bacterium]